MQLSVATPQLCMSSISPALWRAQIFVHEDNELNGKQEWRRAGQEMQMELYAINPVLKTLVLMISVFLYISAYANMRIHTEAANIKNVKSELQELYNRMKGVRSSQGMRQEV